MRLVLKLGTALLSAGLAAGAITAFAGPDGGDSNGTGLFDQVLADARHVQQLQQIARKENDVIKLNCVNDKLIQLKPKLNIAEQLQHADPSNTQAATDLRQAAEEAHNLRTEADQCVGDSLVNTESVTSFTHPDLPDPGMFNPWLPTTLEPPAYASPFN
ncbi:MAG TPA: hypothetical protein VMJ10_30780 [Kofleriaceae bacterium]|nr:hypothetical protein [Kofleriaceae bacterium]